MRLVGRNAATCQVLEENETSETYEATKAYHGQPLHVWRLDYGTLNASGKALSNLTAHFQIEAEWPPCTNWTGLGQYPGPVQWASSFETIQRTGGMQPAELATATAYVLAIDGQHPRFSRWQLDFRFSAVTGTAAGTPPPVRPPPEPEPSRGPEPICDFETPGKWDNCWYGLASPADCYAWIGIGDWPGDPKWTGDCIDGLASGAGSLIVKGWHGITEEEKEWRSTGTFRNGKKHGHWVDTRIDGWTGEGPYVDGKRHGRWIDHGLDRDEALGPLIEIYRNDERIEAWFPNRRR